MKVTSAPALASAAPKAAADAAGSDYRYTHMTLPSKSTPPIPLIIVGPDASIRKA